MTEPWRERPTTRLSIWLGVIAGLIVLVRHPNALYLLFVPLYGVRNPATLRASLLNLAREWRALALAACVAGVVVLPQLVIYYAATGRPFVSSYSVVGSFHFDSPHIWGVLFSVRKGLFFWSPILLLALAGLALTRGAARNFVLPSILVLAANVYLIASWFDWQFGGSYGHRGFVDAFPFLAIGLAAFLDRAAAHRWSRAAVTVVCVGAAALSMFQMLQYWYGIVPFSDLTWPEYRRLFLQWR